MDCRKNRQVALTVPTRGYYSIKALNPTGIRPTGPAHITALMDAVH